MLKLTRQEHCIILYVEGLNEGGKQRIEKLLEIVEDASGDLDKADEAEQRVIEELQGLENEVLHDWDRHKKY